MAPRTLHIAFSAPHPLVCCLGTLAVWLAPMGFTSVLIVALGRYWGAHNEGINASANDLFLWLWLAPIMLVVFSIVDVGAHVVTRRLWKLRGARQQAVALSSMGLVCALAFLIQR